MPREINPFAVKTPEGLDAAETTQLFVDVFTDFFKVREPGHSMVNGPRGSGKSMMFRYLEPDCQCLANKCELQQLDFFAVLVSIKNTELNFTEFRRVSDEYFNTVLSEHILTTYVAAKVFNYLAGIEIDPKGEFLGEVATFAKTAVLTRLAICGLPEAVLTDETSSSAIFKSLASVFDIAYRSIVQYARRLSFSVDAPAVYQGPLCGYLDFLYPILCDLRQLPLMPDGPLYLLLDDADMLSESQTRVLNSWISTRTSHEVSLKISTQLRYKTYGKVSSGTIESPHDYSEVNITDLYTTNRGKYLARVREIVEKRLTCSGINCSADEFFPANKAQEDGVQQIGEEIRSGKHEVSGRGYRASDDVVRYARPIYMANLSGSRKSASSYSYAGFEQLVHVSSGLIRYFLEPAALMFSEQQAETSKVPNQISPKIQNREIRRMSDNLMSSEFEKIDEATVSQSEIDFSATKEKLRNLIAALGGAFRRKLVSNAAERRVFSVAFSDAPQSDVVEVFELGVQFGYFQKSAIGNKDGTGRTTLYILTRRLAPYFGLDPSGFAGYLFVTNERLREAMHNPSKLLRKIKERGVDEVLGEERQLSLFE